MLILFKPWRYASDLRENNQKWEEAFELFQENCSDRVTKILDNMQILHECHDSGNDHFSQRRHRGHSTRLSQSNQHVESADDFGPIEASVILDHLESIIASSSEKISRSKTSVEECLLHANMSGMFDIMPVPDTSTNSNANMENKIKEVHQSDLEMEENRRTEYENRRNQWKRKTEINSDKNSPLESEKDKFNQQTISASDGSDFQRAFNLDNQHILNATISQPILSVPTDNRNNIDIDAMIKEFTLNTEQARAFKIICEHSMDLQKNALKMYIGGAGSTGKSRVINALKEFFFTKRSRTSFTISFLYWHCCKEHLGDDSTCCFRS